MGLFYFIISAVIGGMQLVAAAWFIKCFPQIGWKMPLLSVLVLTGLVLLGFVYTHSHHQGVLAGILYYVSYTWFGFVFLAFCCCVAFAVANSVLAWCHVPTGWMGMLSLLVLVGVWTAALWGGFSQPRIKYVRVKIPQAPSMKLALLSDTHLGMGVSLERFKRVMRQIAAEKPDALFVLGDIFEYGPNLAAYAQPIRQLHTPLGTYGVLGNHEYYVGYTNSKDLFAQAGIKLLENQSVLLPNGVQVVGLKDIKTAGVREQDVEQLLRALPEGKSTFLLSHTPLYAENAAKHGVHLMLSGHTHNGQLWPFTYLVKMQFPRVYGLFDVNGMKFYITSGIFYWGTPLRFLSAPEIVIVEVNPA